MKSSKLVKIILIIIISLSMVLFASQVLAETDLTPTLTGSGSTGGSSSSGGSVLNIPSSSTNNTTNNTINNTVLKTNNTSDYNNSSLPKTGIENSVPSVILVVVLGISAVYAYKKMQDYKNI